MSFWSDDAIGWVRVATFVPLVVCSVIGFALTLVKWRGTRPLDPADEEERARFMGLLRAGHYAQAATVATSDSPLSVRIGARVARQAGGRRDRLMHQAEHLGRSAARHLERGLGGLALIATLGPLFGLLGTVVGIILVFGQLTATGGAASPQQLAGGIGTALYTTVAGLLVGVCALVSHYLIVARIDGHVAELETDAVEVVELVCRDDP